jgi:type II secretory pathway component GspD/PulD (secretin)
MKKWILRLMAVCAAGMILPACAQTSTNEMPQDNGNQPMQGVDGAQPPDMPPGPPEQSAPSEADTASMPPAPVETEAPAPASAPNMLPTASVRMVPAQSQATSAVPSTEVQTPSQFVPPSETANSNPDNLRLNFDNVPLNMVLNYLSDAAGFIIVMDTQVRGNVSVISSHPMTRDEAVNLLNSVLNQNGYAAIRNGRTLTILDKNDAKTRNIPVQVGNNPASIPRNDEIVTQIIPIRYVDASQLVTDLSSFVSPQATIVANSAGNSIVITDTQENIRHLVEIISAIDSSAAGETEIQVFHLNYANPNDVATELGDMFQSSGTGSSSGGQLPIRFGGGPGGFGGGFGGGGGFFARMMAANGGGGGSGGSSNNRAQKQSQVNAVADARTQSIIVMASKDLMPEIAGMMDQLDVPSTRDQKVYVYHMSNGDPQMAMQVLQNMFGGSGSSSRGGSSSSSSQQTENSPLIQRANQNATTVGQTSSTLSAGLGTSGTGRGAGGGGGAP